MTEEQAKTSQDENRKQALEKAARQVKEQPAERQPTLTIEQATEQLAQRRDDAAAAAERRSEPPAETTPQPVSGPAPAEDVGWTNEEIAFRDQLNKALDALQRDAIQFGQARQQAEQQGGSEEQKQALRVQIGEAEKELANRYSEIIKGFEQLTQHRQQRAGELAQRQLEAERRRLEEAVPDFDPNRVVSYLEGYGFTRAELAEMTDARMAIIADKARRFDEMQGEKPKRQPKKTTKRKAEPQNVSQLHTRKPRNAKEAEARLKKSGRIEDAVALLKHRRRSA